MKGNRVYLTMKELELIRDVFDYGNWGCDGNPNEEELTETRDKLFEKVSKILGY